MIGIKNILWGGTCARSSTLCFMEEVVSSGKRCTIEYLRKIVDGGNTPLFEEQSMQYVLNIGQQYFKKTCCLNLKLNLVFIDADKINYSNYFDLVIDKLVPGGFLVTDNVLWSGKAVEKVKQDDKDTKVLIDFNDKIQRDPRVESALFPVRDGLMIMRKF